MSTVIKSNINYDSLIIFIFYTVNVTVIKIERNHRQTCSFKYLVNIYQMLYGDTINIIAQLNIFNFNYDTNMNRRMRKIIKRMIFVSHLLFLLVWEFLQINMKSFKCLTNTFSSCEIRDSRTWSQKRFITKQRVSCYKQMSRKFQSTVNECASYHILHSMAWLPQDYL